MGDPAHVTRLPEKPSEAQLGSWKEIAAYLGRDVTTVQRWEKREGMPVYRHIHDKRGSVYALTSELDAWRESRKPRVDENSQPQPPNELASHASVSTESISMTVSPRRLRRWFAVAGAVAIGLVTVSYFMLRKHAAVAAQPRIQSLAVLPLKNITGDPSQEYFADGMTQDLIFELGKVSAVRVISRQSIMKYKGSKKPLQEIARELNVDALLQGAIERSGDRVRVSIRLDQVSPETQLWANQYDRDLRDVLGLQDEIARTVATEIQVKLTSQEGARLATAGPVDPEAHDDYLRGRYQISQLLTSLTSRTADPDAREDYIQIAIGYFKQAVEKEPDYASPYAGLADAYIALGGPDFGADPPRRIVLEAKAAATRALELNPSLAEAHFSLARIDELYDWNWPEAEKEYRVALNLNPNYAEAHWQYGRFLQAMRRNHDAMTQVKYAIELDPLDTETRIAVAYITYASRQYDLAIQQFKSLDDDFGLGWAYREKKMYPEAVAALQRSVNKSRRSSVPLASLADVYGLAGRKDEALKLIEELKERSRQGYVSGFLLAEAYGGLGEKDQALTWLERAYEDRDQWMVFMATYPGLDPLRSEPRFQALQRRMNFPQ